MCENESGDGTFDVAHPEGWAIEGHTVICPDCANPDTREGYAEPLPESDPDDDL